MHLRDKMVDNDDARVGTHGRDSIAEDLLRSFVSPVVEDVSEEVDTRT